MQTSTANILVIEDDPLSLYSMVDFLRAENFQVTGVTDGDIALKMIEHKSFDLVVCDLFLPNLNGYEVLSSLKKNIDTADIPFIVVSGKSRRQDIRLGMELGVSDYLTKPFFNDELIRAINAQLEKKRFLEECYQAKSQKKIFLEKCYQVKAQTSDKTVIQKRPSKASLYYDDLTKLPIQLFLRDIFESEKMANQCVQAQIKLNPLNKNINTSIAVCYFSLGSVEEIKVIDSLASEQRDKIIQIAAQKLKHSLGTKAKIIRLNEENFVVILSYVGNLKEAIKIIKIAQVNLFKPFDVSNKKISLTPYVGISFYPVHGEDIATLLTKAKQAVEYTKQKSEESYGIYRLELENKLDFKSWILVNDLRQALRHSELEINYQPQINLYTREIVGCEALIRWNHPQRGFIPPTTFLPIAEDSGLIYSIGTWFISTVCQQLKTWHRAGFTQLKLTINLSDYQLKQNNLISIIVGVLEQAKLTPQSLAIEITESSLFNNFPGTIEQLNRIKSLGIEIILDNFGLGYSSLNYLKRFDFDILKVDMCYLDYLLGEKKSQVAIDYIIKTARNLNKKVIVEKVETQEQLNCLRKHQCKQAQGFILSMPLIANELEQLLREESDWLSILFGLPPI
ncbi:MAG: EAL domain-containing response regulator [Waterburya sp.]